MSTSKYRAFQVAAQLQSLTRAAEALGYTQSGVSHLISALEEELGSVLLVRSKSGAKLTPEGERLIRHVDRMLLAERDLLAAAADLRGLSAGTIRIGTFSSVAIHWLPEILRAFGERYPGISIKMLNGTYSDVEEALLDNRVDCGFVTLPSRAEFTVEPLTRDRLLVVLHAGHPLSACPWLTPQMLAEQPFIVPAEGTNYDIGKLFAAAKVTLNVHFDVNDDYAAVAMVRQGLGYTILPDLMMQEFPLEQLKTVPILNSEREIGIALNKARYLSPPIKAFILVLRQWLTGSGR